MNRIKLNILSPWPVLIVLVMFVSFISVVALADHDDDNYEKQKAAIDRANDGIVGYTHDGIPVYESELPNGDVQLGQALGLRQLDINIKDIKKISTNVVSKNSIELVLDDKEYNIVFGDCSVTDIDNFQFQTRGDGKLDVGDFAIVRRNPFKYFDNPKLDLSKSQIESKLKNWDMAVRVCTIAAISKIEIKVPETNEAVRG